jgi:hypothetical protein
MVRNLKVFSKDVKNREVIELKLGTTDVFKNVPKWENLWPMRLPRFKNAPIRCEEANYSTLAI